MVVHTDLYQSNDLTDTKKKVMFLLFSDIHALHLCFKFPTDLISCARDYSLESKAYMGLRTSQAHKPIVRSLIQCNYNIFPL